MDMMWWMPVGMLMAGLFSVLVVVAIVVALWALLGRQRSGGTSRPADRALEILGERYARGEITREEFEARRRDLVA